MDYLPDRLDPCRFESFRKLAKFLKKQPEIESVKLNRGRNLRVKYKNGFVEYWTWDDKYKGKFTYYKIPNSKDMYLFNNEWPEFRCQFTRVSGEEEYEKKNKFFLYTYKYLCKFKFANRKVFLNKLACQLEKEGYIRPWLPKENIKRIINRVNDCVLVDRFDNGYSYHERSRPAFLAQSLSVMTNDSEAPDRWNSFNICCAIHRLFNKKMSITRNSIVWAMRKNRNFVHNRGFPIALAAFLRDKYPDRKIINKTRLYWVDVAIALYSNGCSQSGNEVNIVMKGDKGNVIIGDGEYTFISGYYFETHRKRKIKVGIGY